MDRDKAFALVNNEIEHQRSKWGREDGDWPSTPERKLVILAEEFGEIAMGMNDGDWDNVRVELAQVAAT
jgi:NTP pyrophosphatase (non-canonical NTP hydrolase)